MDRALVRPWAVRAVSGHSTHPDPAKKLLELDLHKFAISLSLSLLNQLGGAFHATSCRNESIFDHVKGDIARS